MIENAGLVEKLEAHAGFMENGGICEHSMTDEPGLLREAAQRIRELEAALAAEVVRNRGPATQDWTSTAICEALDAVATAIEALASKEPS